MEIILKQDLNQTIYKKLREVARGKRVITYSNLGKIIGLGGHDPRLWKMLDDINRYEHQQGHPMLSAVVNVQEKNAPGEGFFKIAHELGVYRGGSEDTFFHSELRKVHECWSPNKLI